MFSSQVTQLWNGGQNPMNLKVIKLHYSESLNTLPNLSGSPNIEQIHFFRCKSLVEIPMYFQDLDKLTYLDLGLCKSIEYLPKMSGTIEFLRPSDICVVVEEVGRRMLSRRKWVHPRWDSSNKNPSYQVAGRLLQKTAQTHRCSGQIRALRNLAGAVGCFTSSAYKCCQFFPEAHRVTTLHLRLFFLF
ncbi:hypothetical protein C1H46_004887 [Malus baccata]|uniref:Uncharacterized protein n=1 Tax=Malus baccata TaxID=106549 RepID=A0A540NES9_MALBA|nr:hypothetical protein C1H46_004887 [Malus baccata]